MLCRDAGEGGYGLMSGSVKVVQILGVIACLLCALVVLVNVGIGAAYHRDQASGYLVPAALLFGAIGICLYVLLQKRGGAFGTLLNGLSVLIGAAVSVFGAYLIFGDPGDALLWSPVLALGLCLTLAGVTKFMKGGAHALS